MDSIGVNNLRSLHSINVDLKPITVFVGKNSAGKSTLLRVFPLLKQTFETHTSEPVLWYGKYVDFGDFDQSLSHDSLNNTIEFSFSLSCAPRLRTISSMTITKTIKEYHVTIACEKSNIAWISILFDDQKIKICFSPNSEITQLSVNDANYSPQYLHVARVRSFFPLIAPAMVSRYTDEQVLSNPELRQETVLHELVEQFKPFRHTNTKDMTVYRAVNRMMSGSREENYSALLQNKSFPEGMLRSLGSHLQFASTTFENINNLLVIHSLPSIWRTLREQIMTEITNVRYSKPLRTTAERYYRIQGLSVDEVDPSGENLAMVMNSMRDSTRAKFAEWTEKTFGCRFSTVTRGGHASIVVKDSKSKHEDNLADTGFGYSQVLPILLSVWLTTVQKQDRAYVLAEPFFGYLSSNNYYEVIEQPELHLHPAFQAKLIDVFAKIVTQEEKKNDIKFILETHSETIINRLGYLIYKKVLSPEMVNIVVFNKNEGDVSSVSQIGFNEKGQLKNWPIGFFQPDEV